MPAIVIAVSRSSVHEFSKEVVDAITLLEGLGVQGDTHAGKTVQHRSRVARDPLQPNLRQVHLIHAELLDELRSAGFVVSPGQLGENITTRGIDLLALPAGAILKIGGEAIIKIAGLRNPCQQIEQFQPGLLSRVVDRDTQGNLIRKAGVMAVVVRSGVIRAGDKIEVELPAGERLPLKPV